MSLLLFVWKKQGNWIGVERARRPTDAKPGGSLTKNKTCLPLLSFWHFTSDVVNPNPDISFVMILNFSFVQTNLCWDNDRDCRIGQFQQYHDERFVFDFCTLHLQFCTYIYVVELLYPFKWHHRMRRKCTHSYMWVTMLFFYWLIKYIIVMQNIILLMII